jgi:4'-phosphopantetheinyl transferase
LQKPLGAEPGSLKLGEVHLWAGDLRLPPLHVLRGYEILTGDEKAQANRYKFERDRNRFIIARSLMRRLLGEYLGLGPGEIRLEKNARGKPFLEGDPLHFNLSHSGDKYILAASLEPVGVDIEHFRYKADLAAMAELVFSPTELKHWTASESKVLPFFRIWTRKEALLKAIGCGITEHCPDVTVLFGTDLPIIPPSLSSLQWNLVDLPFEPPLIGSLATPIIAPTVIWQN